MNTQFIKFSKPDEAQEYLEKKWKNATQKNLPAYDDIAIRSYFLSQSEQDDLALISSNQMISFSTDHLEVFSTLAGQYMPNLDNEKLVCADELLIFEKGGTFPSGTLVLKRHTNYAEMYIYLSEFRVIKEVLYRPFLDEINLEERLKSISSSKYWEDFNCEELPYNKEVLADPITLSIVAGKILMALLTGAASAIGGKAVSWAMKELGLSGLVGDQAALTYNELVLALKIQARKDYQQKIKVSFNDYHRKLDDYNNGARTVEQLNAVYYQSVKLVSIVQEDERSPDRVHYLAFAISAYLAVMQERAEWYREKDEEKFKSFYVAFQKAAERELEILRRVQVEAEEYRLAKISMYKRRRDFWGWLVYFDDVEKPEDNWTRYNIECAKWGHRGGHYQCLRWTHDTSSYRRGVKHLEKTRAVHVAKIHGEVKHALRGLDITYEHIQRIVNMDIPPPPPKK